jgi:formamidopyrimidine-DNA glycosylase
MPELPEVETIRLGLARVLPGKTVERVEVRFAGAVAAPGREHFERCLPGRMFTGTGRRGKYLLCCLDDQSVLAVHLRMTGKLIYSEGGLVADRHTHVVFSLGAETYLSFHDIRKFGRLWWLPGERVKEISGLTSLGPEPLSAQFDLAYLAGRLQKRSTSIKAVLLDQGFVAGLGNIYSDEILHRSGLLPARRADSLTAEEMKALLSAVRAVLTEAIAWRGTTFSDYRDAAGHAGGFQDRLSVYRRHNQPCLTCGTVINRTATAGRGTHFCPVCQR